MGSLAARATGNLGVPLAGNLLVVGSLANIIALERARDAGVTLTFAEHAKCGVPMTLLSLLLALAWICAMGYAGF